MPSGGSLILETRNVHCDARILAAEPGVKPDPFVQLTVRDTGIGIDPELLPHIFEPFLSTKAEAHGTGLGLSTVFGVVKQAGGWIAVQTEPGAGTAFQVYLPRL